VCASDTKARRATDAMPTDKHIFVNNVYKEMDGQEGNLCTDPDCSRILERLLSVSTAGQARILLNKMQGDVLFVMTHRNGSHVLQSLLSYVPEWLQTPSAVGASEADNVGEDVPSIEQLLVNVCAVCRSRNAPSPLNPSSGNIATSSRSDVRCVRLTRLPRAPERALWTASRDAYSLQKLEKVPRGRPAHQDARGVLRRSVAHLHLLLHDLT